MAIPTLNQMLEALHISINLSTEKEITKACSLISEVQAFDSGERDTIKACYLKGPLFDGDIPSKIARDKLIEKGFIAKVVVKGEDGFNACTQKGFYGYKLIRIEA
jgi:hypothetical protein